MLHHKTRQKIEKIALSWLGTPFHENAELKGLGCDCAGLIIGVLNESIGIKITRDDGVDSALLQHFTEIKTPSISDIIFFSKPELEGEFHAAILLSENRIIHARQSQGVILNSFTAGLRKMAKTFYTLKV